MLRTLCRTIPLAAFMVASAHANEMPDPEQVLRTLMSNNPSAYLSQSQQNLMMMADNPAIWTAEEGEEIFHKPQGPKQVSLAGCDFGKGPGVLEGAYVELPRYFPDTGRVMDLETRLVHCQMTLQGYPADDNVIKQRHGSHSVHMKLQTYIASKSNGMAWNPPMSHPKEVEMRDVGEAIYYRRAGSFDFNCASCHGDTGKRIRASVLPNTGLPHEWTKAISWPAFRVGHDHTRSSQHRLNECYWQMRHAEPVAGSDVTIALISYWTDKARGQPAILADMKR
jgi:L-cysteine S-thiosulfotransferase